MKVHKMKRNVLIVPSTQILEEALDKEKRKFSYKKIIKNMVYALIIVIAFSVLCSTLVFHVLKIYGNSMKPSLNEGELVLCLNKNKFKMGDIIAFYYNNKILIKRVIATSSDWVNIDEKGKVYVNDELLEEEYVDEKVLGESDIKYPYQVPDNSYFILGDKRDTSIDSRNSKLGTITKDEIIGKVVLRLWPLKRFGLIK